MNKKELIEKVEESERIYHSEIIDSETPDLRELVNLKANVGILKSELYISMDEFPTRQEGFYYINRCEALREKLAFDLDYETKLLLKIKSKAMSSMGQSAWQVFLRDCKSEL